MTQFQFAMRELFSDLGFEVYIQTNEDKSVSGIVWKRWPNRNIVGKPHEKVTKTELVSLLLEDIKHL